MTRQELRELEIANKSMTRTTLSELLKVFGSDGRKACLRRLDYLRYLQNGLRMVINTDLKEINATYHNEFSNWFWKQWLKINEVEQYNKIVKEIRMIEAALNPSKTDEITPSMIERAKQYPIEKLIKCQANGIAVCPFHEDSRPSLNVKNNYAYCHACGYRNDVIGVYMDLYHVGFKEAVKALN